MPNIINLGHGQNHNVKEENLKKVMIKKFNKNLVNHFSITINKI